MVLNSGIVLNMSIDLRKENNQESALRIAGYSNQSQMERLRFQRVQKVLDFVTEMKRNLEV